MSRWRYRPSKPAAVLSALIGAGMLVIALTSMRHGSAFFVFWCVCVVAIVAFHLWAAFSPRGSIYEVRSDDDSPPRRFGARVERTRAGRH